MPSKLQMVSELADQTAYRVTQTPYAWMDYLNTASRLYKYSFDDQILLYAQKPDATACASMEFWNKTMRRWVRAGTRGIALIHKDGGQPHLDYVFDVSDTKMVSGAKTPWLWQYRPEHRESVVSALGRRYGLAQQNDIGEQLMETARIAVNEVYRDHLRDLAYDADGSFLEELDDLNLEVRYRNVLTASVQYTLLVRCGLDPMDYLEPEDLRGIIEFSTPAVLHHVGVTVSSVSKDVFAEIRSAILNYERMAQMTRENISQNSLANQPVIGYNTTREDFNTVNRESTERGVQNGTTDIHQGGRLLSSGPGAGRGGRTGGNAPRQVRYAERDLPERESSRNLHLDAADRTAVPPSAGNRPAGPGTGEPDRGQPETEQRRGRGNEGQRPDGLGAGGEQLHRPGRGNRADGDRLQITQEAKPDMAKAAEEQSAAFPSADAEASEQEAPPLPPFQLFPSVEEQIDNITEAKAEEQRPAPTQIEITAEQVPETVIGRALTAGGNGQHSIERIIAHFQKSPETQDSVQFLRNEFGSGGKGVSIAGEKYALLYSDDGIRIAPGRTALGPGSTFVSWDQAATMIHRLLEQGLYAPQGKIDSARENEYQELAERLAYMRQDFSEEARGQGFLPSIEEAYSENLYPEITLQIAELLKKPETRAEIISDTLRFAIAYQNNHALLRFRQRIPPLDLYSQIANLDKPVTDFHAVEGFEPVKGSFITDDEIDQLLQRGREVSEQKIRIYAYIAQGHNDRECADFLRHEHGDGGYSSTGYDEWHDSKGIRYRREDDFSGYEGYDTVLLNWNQVQKRIRQMIDKGHYLNEKEQAYLPQYERLQLAREIYAFRYYNPNDPERSYPHEWDPKAAESEILPIINTPGQAAAIYEQMKEAFARVAPEDSAYPRMEPAMRNLAAFLRGEYSLFKPLPEAELEAERRQRQEKKQEKGAVSRLPETGSSEQEPAPAPGTLAAAARALARKHPAQTGEDPSGQFSFFQADAEQERQQGPISEPIAVPPATDSPIRKTVVVETILSPDLERERQAKETALKKAEQTLAERGIVVPPKIMDYITLELGRGAVFYDRIVARVDEILNPVPDPDTAEKYQLGYGFMGNGLTVWNSREIEHGDYKTIAHIEADRAVRFYDSGLPGSVKTRILHVAATSNDTISASQDSHVFSVPPMTNPLTRETQGLEEKVSDEYEAQETELDADESPISSNNDLQAAEAGSPETQTDNTPDRDKLPYKVGDTVYVEHTEFQITEIQDSSVQLLDPSLDYPIFRSENREFFENLLRLDSRNYAITDYLPVNLESTDADLQDILISDGGLLENKDKEQIAEWFRQGKGNSEITRRMAMTYGRIVETMTLVTGETADYFTSYTGLGFEIQDKFHSKRSFTWDTIVPVLRAMYQEERNGFFHSPVLPEPIPVQDHPQEVAAPSHVDNPQASETQAQPDLAELEGRENPPQPEPVKPLQAKQSDNNRQEPAEPPKTRRRRSKQELAYAAFEHLFPEILSKEYRSLEMEAGFAMMPLHVQWISEDSVAISHTYEQLGDIMYDPEMTFRVDRNAGTLEPLTYQQDNLGVFQNVYPEPGKWIPKLRTDLTQFTRQWFENIAQQGYVKTRAVAEINGEDVEITFDKDGKTSPEQSETGKLEAEVEAADTGTSPTADDAGAGLTEAAEFNVRIHSLNRSCRPNWNRIST